VATTYFTNWAVLNNAAASDVVLALGEQPGVEIGMHIHPWNTPPLLHKGVVSCRETFLENLPQDVVHAKLDTVYSTFLKCGLRPTSFRGGRYSSGPTVQEYLRCHRFLADASVAPYMTWRDAGAPDYRRRGPEPVRLPPRQSGELPLWEIPLTQSFTRRPARFWQECFNLIENSWLAHLHLIGIADRLGIVRKVWLNFEQPTSGDLLPFLADLRFRKLPCICFTVHSSSFLPGGSPYTRTDADEERLFARMEAVFATLATWPEFQPATVTQVARQLEEDFHARSRHQPVG
jgi:hypothetical protein